MGNSQLSISYFEWYVYDWYTEQKETGKIKSSPYDALSLCYSLIGLDPKYSTDVKKGVLWYKTMT